MKFLRIEDFVPLSVRDHTDDLRRSKIVVMLAFALFPLGVIYSLLYYGLGNFLTGTTIALVAITVITIPFIFKFVGSYRTYGHVISLGIFICVLAAYTTSGNANFTGIPWFIISPIVAFMISELRWGLIWFFLALAVITAMFVIQYEFGIPIPNHTSGSLQSHALLKFLDWFHYAGSLIAVVISISVFESSRKIAADSEKLSYEKLAAAKTQLFQAEKLSAIGQMVAGVAHEVNTPRATVDHLIVLTERQVDKILRSQGLSQETESEVAAIKERLLPAMNLAITRIGELTEGLLNFTRIEHREMKKSDIHQILETALVLLRGKIHSKIELVKQYGDIPEILCYPGQISQVFMNILTNALQALPAEGGRIRIRTSRENGGVHISIKDNGSGMDEPTRKKIFDPFFTTKEIGRGTGLGMSIVWDILQKHKAKIQVQSEPGQGTDITIKIPIES